MEIKKLKKEVKNSLSPYRYNHSIAVAEVAKNLAKHYHIETIKAYTAGLLHDIAKELTEEENNYWIDKYKLQKKLKEKEYKNIKHAEIGAVIAKEKYHLKKDICDAIKYHTIGNKNMDTLAKIIYISDKIGRKNIPKELKPLEKLVYQDLDKALLYCLEQEQNYLKQKNIKINKNTKELVKELKKHFQNGEKLN